MKHDAALLAPDYLRAMASMRITKPSLIDGAAKKLLALVHQERYGLVPKMTGIPVIFIATSFEREASSDFTRSPAQGDRWNRKSVNVPEGRGPFTSWAAAALDAYHLNGLDKVGAANWTWALLCYFGELFNGFGYRDYHHMLTPYLFGGTSLQTIGKYTTDHGFDDRHMDEQIGIVPVMMRMVQLDPSLAIPGAWPFQSSAVAPSIVPAQAPIKSSTAVYDIEAIQRALLAKGFNPAGIDGSFGRKTSAALRAFETSQGFVADGLLDPQTVRALGVKVA